MTTWRSLIAIPPFLLTFALGAPAEADILEAVAATRDGGGGSSAFSLTNEQKAPGVSFSSPSAIVDATTPITFVEGECGGVKCVQYAAHPIVGPGPSMSLAGSLDSFIPPAGSFSPCVFDQCVRDVTVKGSLVFDNVLITSTDPSVRTVQTSFNVDLTGSVFVFAINPGTEAFAQVGVTFLAADCNDFFTDRLSQFYEECVLGNGGLIQVAQSNSLTLVARNLTSAGSSVSGTGLFASLNEPGTSLATTFTVPVAVSATSPAFFAPVGRPFSVGLLVDTEMQVFFPHPFKTREGLRCKALRSARSDGRC